MNLQEHFNDVCQNMYLASDGRVYPNDMVEASQKLRELSSQCTHVTEFGVRGVCSTWALMAGMPKVIQSYDIDDCEVEEARRVAADNHIIFNFTKGNTVDPATKIEETDLLFIDTFHFDGQLEKELEQHASKVRKFIAFHDTVFVPSLMVVISKFLSEHAEWKLKEHIGGRYGLTVIKKIDSPVVSCNSCTAPAVLQALQLNKLSFGCYVEFGVFRGGSFAQVLTVLEDRRYLNSILQKADSIKITKCYGFDSFEGFPEPKEDIEKIYGKGLMGDTSYETVCHAIEALKVQIPYELVQGFFSDSLPNKILEIGRAHV
jgi:hypothetical protein